MSHAGKTAVIKKGKRHVTDIDGKGTIGESPECHEPLGRSKQGWSITSSIMETVAYDRFTRKATSTLSSECWSRDSGVIRWIC